MEGCCCSRSTGVRVSSSRSASSETILSGFFPLSVGNKEGVEGPAVELADVGGEESSFRRRIELRHERLRSVAGWEVILLTRLRILLGLTKLRILLRIEADLEDPG